MFECEGLIVKTNENEAETFGCSMPEINLGSFQRRVPGHIGA